jgi:hypothetical protein
MAREPATNEQISRMKDVLSRTQGITPCVLEMMMTLIDASEHLTKCVLIKCTDPVVGVELRDARRALADFNTWRIRRGVKADFFVDYQRGWGYRIELRVDPNQDTPFCGQRVLYGHGAGLEMRIIEGPSHLGQQHFEIVVTQKGVEITRMNVKPFMTVAALIEFINEFPLADLECEFAGLAKQQTLDSFVRVVIDKINAATKTE